MPYDNTAVVPTAVYRNVASFLQGRKSDMQVRCVRDVCAPHLALICVHCAQLFDKLTTTALNQELKVRVLC